MQIGIVGLPNVGKSTLFNAITRAQAAVASYPFTTVEPNVGIAEVPDQRLWEIAAVTHPAKVVPATIKFLDIAGLVRGASKGEGLGNQFLSHIRPCDAIAHVVRCFEDENITHVSGEVNPLKDIEIVNLELILADSAVADKALHKAEQSVKSDKKHKEEVELLGHIKEILDAGLPVRSMKLTSDQTRVLSSFSLLTAKPMIYVANLSEGHLNEPDHPWVREVFDWAQAEGSQALIICAKLEAEIAELDKEEAKAFLQELGFAESGLERFVQASYRLLDLITFFTIDSNETRAWTIPRGTRAPEAAGKIHSDMEKGFIKAEVVSYQDLVRAGSFHKAREEGHFKIEGMEYGVLDGDVLHFKFAV